jgi:signal transduction histidine kinase/GAF domain-containing protein
VTSNQLCDNTSLSGAEATNFDDDVAGIESSMWGGKEAMEARAHPTDEFAIIERIAHIVSTVRGAKSDYASLAAELEQAVPFDIFGVVLLRHDGKALRITTCEREGHTWVARYHQHPLAESRFQRMMDAPALVVRDYPTGLDGPPSKSGDALNRYHQLQSTLIVPLVVGEHVLGSLELGSVGLHTYARPALQRLVDAVARMLATAIESVQLGGNTAIQDRQRRALKDVSSALTEKMDLSVILKQVVSGISDTLNVASCICLWDQPGGTFRLEAQAGLGQQTFAKVFASGFPVRTDCILGRSLLSRKAFVSNDIAQDELYPASQIFFRELGLHSMLSHPLMTGTAIYGVLCLCSSESGGFTPLKSDILGLFANQATIAIHNGMLLESVHQRSRFQQAIEQLEQLRRQRPEGEHDGEDDLQEELALLAHVREETQSTFGISFSSFLRFISDYLLTQNERRLQQQFVPATASPSVGLAGLLQANIGSGGSEASLLDRLEQEKAAPEIPFAQTLSHLAQTAGSALTRAGMVGELGRLLMQLKQSTGGVRDAWFVVDLHGMCTYMNPAAEALCDIRLEAMPLSYGSQFLAPALEQGQSASLKIEDVFSRLFPRMRNADEIAGYLREFTQEHAYRQEMRCILATEPVSSALSTSPLDEVDKPSARRESASVDYHYQLTRYPLYDQEYQLAAYVLQVQDITEQVRDEKNRSALLSSVSHDLRTPLTTIKAAVTGLLQADVPWSEEDRQEMLEDVNRETDHLTVLVSSWVELSRIEMGALILEKEWCDVVEVFYGALLKMGRVLGGRHIIPQAQTPLPLIYADHVQLERVFRYLIENAVQHSPADTDINVLMDTLEEDVKMLRIRVIDHGEGVPENERERIFKSFYSPRSYGNGMGLAICRGVIEAHQGQIWLEALDQPGACFALTLPIHPNTAVSTGESAGLLSRKDKDASEEQEDPRHPHESLANPLKGELQ